MNYLFVTLLSVAFLVIECLAGGTRLIYSLPVYGLLGIASLLTVFSPRGARTPARPACLISSAVFFGYILARCYLSPVEYLSRQDFFMVLGSLAVYLLTALHIVKSRHRMILLGVLMVIALGQVAVGLIQFSRGNDFMLFGYGRYPNGNRASGQYISPNHLAGYLEVVAIMGISLVFWSMSKPWVKILMAYTSMVAFGGILITGSRGGYASTVFCVVSFCIISIVVVKIAFPERFFRITAIIVAFMVLLSVLLPLVVTSQLVKSRASTIFEKNMRLQLWQAAISEIKLEPLFGTGSGTYLYYGRKFRDPEVQRDPVRVHNDYLDLIAEYGILGGVGFLIFFGVHVWNGIHTFRWLVVKRMQFSLDWRSNSLALNIGCMCAIAAYVVHSVVDFNLHIPANSMLMAFVFGIIANPGLETFQARRPSLILNRIFQFSLPILGVAILYAGVPKISGEYYAEKARVALRDKDFALSVLDAKAGIAREQKNPDLYYYLGEARRNLGDAFPAPMDATFYRLASEAFKQGLQLFPEDERLLLIEGWTLDALGESSDAETYYEQALKWDPKSEQVQETYKTHLKFLIDSGKIQQFR
ncbi:MAG: O-antigen ligase family protein [Chthoniobacteraceae bacterium]